MAGFPRLFFVLILFLDVRSIPLFSQNKEDLVSYRILKVLITTLLHLILECDITQASFQERR